MIKLTLVKFIRHLMLILLGQKSINPQADKNSNPDLPDA